MDRATDAVFVSDDILADTIEYACDILGRQIHSAHDTEDGIIAEIDARREAERMARKKVTLPTVKFLDATPERLRHANDNTRLAATNVDGKLQDGVRVIEDDPLDRMYRRRQLDADPERNETLYAAGKRYYSDWYQAGLSGIGAMNPEAIGGGSGDPAYMMPASERAAHKRQEFRKARAAVPARLIGILDAVVLEGRTLSDAGAGRTGYKSRPQITAAAMERLAAGLACLAHHYGIDRSIMAA